MAFALTETALVIYITKMIGIENLASRISGNNFRPLLDLGAITFLRFSDAYRALPLNQNLEMAREIGTLAVLISTAYLVERNWKRFSWMFLFLFSVWDLSYYVFLKIITDWPKGFFDLDIFFFTPVPWIGPVITPIILSFIFLIISIVFLFRIREK